MTDLDHFNFRVEDFFCPGDGRIGRIRALTSRESAVPSLLDASYGSVDAPPFAVRIAAPGLAAGNRPPGA